eukprot:TRINITY_DN104324_c0_g1_i1.p1 TRINITY_DN104324_c0_g1~~TRINITY_DN104324_c0_g1_i1.p1  ORF type:complete len:496 (+),score=40.18 TRINITY_DN104324_c0_g1_i1:35-1489(+)
MGPQKHDRCGVAGALSLQITLLACSSFPGFSLRPVAACFSEDTDVTLANGYARALRYILPGDKVLSWDAETAQLSVSVVRALLRSQRSLKEFVTIELQHASITASGDTPFWSYTRQSIVSLCPEATQRAYSLNVSLMHASDELQSAAVGPQKILRMHRGVHNLSTSSRLGPSVLQSFDCNAPAVNAQMEETGIEAFSELSSRELAQTYSDSLACMTLHLEDLHWFFVNGVQVHNKGGEDKDPVLILGLVLIMATVIFCLGVACCLAAGSAERHQHNQRRKKVEANYKIHGLVARIGKKLSDRLSKVTPYVPQAAPSSEQRDRAKNCSDCHETEVTTHADSIKSQWNCSICNRISHDMKERFTHCRNCALEICSLCLPFSSNTTSSQLAIKSPSQRERMDRAQECATFHDMETRNLVGGIKSRWNCGICNQVSTDREALFAHCRTCALDICSMCLPRSSSSRPPGHSLSEGSSWDDIASDSPTLE